jgi:hypothetical protein
LSLARTSSRLSLEAAGAEASVRFVAGEGYYVVVDDKPVARYESRPDAECGPYGFEIRATPRHGYLLRMWQIRPEDGPLLFWENDGYTLKQAQARAAQLADQHVPAIVAP